MVFCVSVKSLVAETDCTFWAIHFICSSSLFSNLLTELHCCIISLSCFMVLLLPYYPIIVFFRCLVSEYNDFELFWYLHHILAMTCILLLDISPKLFCHTASLVHSHPAALGFVDSQYILVGSVSHLPAALCIRSRLWLHSAGVNTLYILCWTQTHGALLFYCCSPGLGTLLTSIDYFKRQTRLFHLAFAWIWFDFLLFQ